MLVLGLEQSFSLDAGVFVGGTSMDCHAKDELEQHLSDIRKLAAHPGLASEEKEAAARAERFAIAMLKTHDTSGHAGKRCPFATQL
jgi:hypothetical protein